MGIPTDRMAGVNGSSNGSPSSAAAKYNLAPHFIGGSHLDVAAPGKVKDFVAAHDGHTVITNVSLPAPVTWTAQTELLGLSWRNLRIGSPNHLREPQ